MPAQNFSANAPGTTLSGGITNSATSLTLVDGSGWPTTNFVATLERDGSKEEQILIGTRSGNNCTGVTRGYNSTTAVSHDAGAIIEHTFDAASAQRWEDHLFDTTDAHAATAITNTPSGTISATTVQAAINELGTEKAAAAEPIAAAHIIDTSAAHAASSISVSSTTLVGVGTDVQAVFEELDNAIAADVTGLSDHLADTTAAHAASAVSFSATGAIAAVNVQTALAELDTEKVATTRQVISGAGLTGGAALSGDVTLAVGAGTGITVNADSIEITSTLVTLGAFSTWVPVFYGSGAALGSSSYVARYSRVGRMITAKLTFTFGSGGSMAADRFAFSLPVAAYDPGSFVMCLGAGNLTDSGTTQVPCVVMLDHVTDTANDRAHLLSNGNVVMSTWPFTWVTGDGMQLEFSYEAVS